MSSAAEWILAISVLTIYVAHSSDLSIESSNTAIPTEEAIAVREDIPTDFDAREKWRHCMTLDEISDEGSCSSAWAISAASAFSDRLCILSHGKFNSRLSAQEVLTCCRHCGGGCGGGWPEQAWQYFKDNGIATGGNYDSHEGCQPYTIPPCQHYTSGSRRNCSGIVQTPACERTCYNDEHKKHNHTEYHYKVDSTFIISYNNTQVQRELYKNGPLTTSMVIYEDFLTYKKGVYEHLQGKFVSYHAVKVIGWGEENGTPYWLAANSWNTDWGDQGCFKIKRGTNDTDFERNFSGGYPKPFHFD